MIIRRNYPHGDEDGLVFPSYTLDTELLDSLSDDLFLLILIFSLTRSTKYTLMFILNWEPRIPAYLAYLVLLLLFFENFHVFQCEMWIRIFLAVHEIINHNIYFRSHLV